MTHLAPIRRGLLAAALATAGLAAQAADFSFAGTLARNTDVARIDITLTGGAQAPSLWTDSYQSELNFDALIAVFDNSGHLVAFNDDNAVRPSQTGFDAGLFNLPLTAGAYSVYIGASFSAGDPALGSTVAQVFDFSGVTPLAIGAWDQPSYSPNIAASQKGNAWSLHVEDVSLAAAVPEPAATTLLLAGLLVLGAVARRQRG